MDTSNTRSVSDILTQVHKTSTAFQAGHSETDRVAALKAAQTLVAALQTPTESIENVLYSPTQALCVRLGLNLDVFQTLVSKRGPATLEELARPKGADLVLTERVLRILTGIGYVDEVDTRVYAANALTKQLTVRTSAATVTFIFDVTMSVLGDVPTFLRQTGYKNPTGATSGVLQYTHKTPDIIWAWLAARPELFEACNAFMEGVRGSRPSWTTWYPIQERLIDGAAVEDGGVLFVDVAGGRGVDIAELRGRFPDAKGRLILQDRPEVLQDVTGLEGVEKVDIDFFQGQPVQGARVYYMKFILHDWSDDESRIILGHIRAAMKSGYSKLILEEFVLADKDCAMLPAMWDWEMMMFCNSMERSADAWTRLLDSAGFKVVKFWHPPGNGTGIVEAELK